MLFLLPAFPGLYSILKVPEILLDSFQAFLKRGGEERAEGAWTDNMSAAQLGSWPFRPPSGMISLVQASKQIISQAEKGLDDSKSSITRSGLEGQREAISERAGTAGPSADYLCSKRISRGVSPRGSSMLSSRASPTSSSPNYPLEPLIARS